MRKLVLKMSMTLDGFVGGPQGELDWMFPGMSDDASLWLNETIRDASLHIMGSRTFKDMVAWWPTAQDRLAGPMNAIPKAVFSRTGDVAGASTTAALIDAARAAQGVSTVPPDLKTWLEAEIVRGDMTSGVAALKKKPGSYILAHGGASFARSLIATGLVDEYQLLVHPVAIGHGLPLFSELGGPLHLKLMDTKTFSRGVVAHVYNAA